MNEFLQWVYLIYFLTHIPITLLVDLQAVFGQHYPLYLQDIITWYVATFKDHLMRDPPVWFQSFIMAELVFQLPFFFVASYGFYHRENWIRTPSIIYGIHVATTVLPILSEILGNTLNTYQERLLLASIYAPYFFIPLSLAMYMANYEIPFINECERQVQENLKQWNFTNKGYKKNKAH